MKKLVIIFAVLFSGLFANAQEETRRLSSFSEISVQEAIDAYIKSGDKEEIRIEARGNVDLDEVLTDVSGGKLKIHLAGNSHRNVEVTVWVTYREIEALSVSSAASLESENTVNANGDFEISVSSAGDMELSLVAEDVDIDVSSAGDLELDVEADELEINVSSAGDAELEVNVSSVEAEVSSAGDVEIKGTAKDQDIYVGSSGSYNGYDLESEEAKVRASSGGDANVNVSVRIDGEASSGGSIRYKGNPKKVYVNSSSGGSVKKY